MRHCSYRSPPNASDVFSSSEDSTAHESNAFFTSGIFRIGLCFFLGGSREGRGVHLAKQSPEKNNDNNEILIFNGLSFWKPGLLWPVGLLFVLARLTSEDFVLCLCSRQIGSMLFSHHVCLGSWLVLEIFDLAPWKIYHLSCTCPVSLQPTGWGERLVDSDGNKTACSIQGRVLCIKYHQQRGLFI